MPFVNSLAMADHNKGQSLFDHKHQLVTECEFGNWIKMTSAAVSFAA
jgi:hypothetical protein